MIFKRRIVLPHEWHTIFVFFPVLIEEIVQNEQISVPKVYGKEKVEKQVMYEKYAFLKFVERRLEKNMTGTRRWVYRLREKHA